MTDINTQLLEFQNAYNQQIFQREDNAVQRRVADLKNAGLSPILAANGYGASAGGQSQSPTQALNIALDYIVGQGQIEAQLQSAMAQQSSAQANMMNAMIREQELGVQKDYNNRYLDMMAQYYAAMIENLSKQGENYGAQAGKTNKETEMMNYDFDFFKGMSLPTKTGVSISPLVTTGKFLDKDATASFIATEVVKALDNELPTLKNLKKIENKLSEHISSAFKKSASETRNPYKLYNK